MCMQMFFFFIGEKYANGVLWIQFYVVRRGMVYVCVCDKEILVSLTLPP